MKKVLSFLLLVVLVFLCVSCGNKNNGNEFSKVVLTDDSIQIGSIVFSLNLVEEVEKEDDNSYLLTLIKDEAWMKISFFDVSEYSESMQELFAESLQSSWLDSYPSMIELSKLDTVSFDGKTIDFLIYGVDDGNGDYQYHVAGSFCYKGYAYTIAFISDVAETEATEKFIVTLVNSDFLTNGVPHIKEYNDVQEPISKDDSLSSAIFDMAYATDREKAAWEQAQNYFSISAFSREGIIDQLMFEGFTNKEANYAIDHMIIDWKEQAVSKAKEYLLTSSFSYSGLIEQLKFEKFTEDQSIYGAQYCNANWDEQAAKCAESYRRLGLSGQNLYEQLLFEGFSESQAEYGMNNSK